MAARARGLSVTFAQGCNICDEVPPGFPNMPCTKASDSSGIPAAAAAAAAADVAVLFIGSDQTSEAENFDRSAITLQGVQEQLAAAVLAAQPKTVVVFISGGGVSSPATVSGARAVLYAFYGGELGGEAIVDALVGAVSPAGKLPVTLYLPSIAARDIRDVDLASAGGITHLWFPGPVVRPFGFGLRYAEFAFEASLDGTFGAAAPWRIKLSADGSLGAAAAEPRRLHARISSAAASAMASDCVVLVMLRRLDVDSSAGPSAPRQALVAFTRLRGLEPGEARVHTFELTAEALFRAFRGADGAIAPPRGRYRLRVGDVDAPAELGVEVV